MARKSRWQQFTDNFNSVYGSFTTLAKNIESKKAMDEEYTDDNGIALTGADLERAQIRALSDVYTKYGDAAGGLGLRASLAQIESANRENDINAQIMEELIAQRGVLQSGLMRANTNQANASANASNASAANSYSLAGERDTLLPYRVTAAQLGNDQLSFGLERGRALLPSEVSTAEAGAISANANATVDQGTVDSRIAASDAGARTADANADVAENNATISDATVDSTIGANNATNALTVAESELGVNTAERALAAANTEDRILAEVMAGNFDSPEAAEEATISRIQASDMPIARKQQLIRTIQEMGLERLVNEGARFTQEGLNALSRGLDAGIAWYDSVDDGNTLSIQRNDDGTVTVMETRGDATRALFQGSENQVIAELATRVQQPSSALTVAATVADIDRTRSQTALIDRQAFTETLQQDAVRASTDLATAQADRVRQQIEQGENGLGKSEEIALEGLAALMRSAEFVMLGDQDGGAELQQRAIESYRQTMGMPPSGVSRAEWDAMTEEEKALFR